MPTFSDRERGFEAKFVHDDALRFLIMARRDKLFARWLAVTLGLSMTETEDLVRDVIVIPNGHGHDQAVLQHAASLLQSRCKNSNEGLPSVLNRCMQDASRQISEGSVSPSELF